MSEFSAADEVEFLVLVHGRAVLPIRIVSPPAKVAPHHLQLVERRVVWEKGVSFRLAEGHDGLAHEHAPPRVPVPIVRRRRQLHKLLSVGLTGVKLILEKTGEVDASLVE